MNPSPVATSPEGLRERKKARTRATLQQVALRLFQEQGYEQTTVEQIAATAEVSVSTFFRYFPAKEDVVLYDALDPVFAAAFRAQPAQLAPVEALRASLHEVFDALSADELDRQHQRASLAMSVPSLQNAWIGELVRSQGFLAELLAERVGLDSRDPAIRVTSGAVLGAILAVLLPALDKTSDAEVGGFVGAAETALDVVAEGLPLLRGGNAAPTTPH